MIKDGKINVSWFNWSNIGKVLIVAIVAYLFISNLVKGNDPDTAYEMEKIKELQENDKAIIKEVRQEKQDIEDLREDNKQLHEEINEIRGSGDDSLRRADFRDFRDRAERHRMP